MSHIVPELGISMPERTEVSTKEMLTARRGLAGKWFVRTNYSSISIVQSCMRKAQLSLKEGYRTKAESPALVFGTAVHKALEVFYTGEREERILPTNFAKNADLILADANQSDELVYRAIRAFVHQAEPLRALPDTDKRSLSSGVWLLTHYLTSYIDDPFVIMRDERGPLTERFCEAVLFDSAELQITYFGTLDVILQNAATGVILPGDHKTSSVVGNDFYARLKPNHQYSGYVWLAQNALKLECDAFLVNCLQVKARPLTARGGPPQFPRQVTKRTVADLSEFREAVIWAVRQYVTALETGVWPIGEVNSCAMYGGCQYLPVCSSPAEIRANVLDASFLKGN